MSNLAKSALLSLGLVVGVAAAAQAQSSSLAALPPGAAAQPAVVHSGNYPGPNPGKGWYSSAEHQTQGVQPSTTYPGPNPGKGWYLKSEQTHAVEPSPKYVGPAPH